MPLAGRCCALLSLLIMGVTHSPASFADPTDNTKLFKSQCGTCHTLAENGGRRQGPNLWHFLKRDAGKLDGFKYSKGLTAADWVWTREQLDKWLENPKAVIPDTFMAYKQADAVIRQRLIDHVMASTQ